MLDWNKIWETLLPLLIMGILTGVCTVIYKSKKSLYLWLKRFNLFLFPVKFNVGLSINTKEGINNGKYFSEIKSNLEKNIDNLGLSKIIIIKDFSDIYAFQNKSEAEKYRNKKNLDLIIWGEFSADGLKSNNETISKMTLNFTYSYPKYINDKENKLGKSVILDIGSKLAIKNYWQIVENNSLEDIKVVSNNLVDISLYIIGLTLKLYGRLNESKEIFEKLYKKLELSDDNFKNLVQPHLFDCYTIFINEIIANKKNYKEGIILCEKILRVDNKNYLALTNLATFAYKFGDSHKCEKVVELLLSLYPKEPHTEVDVAFIRITQKNFKNAYKHYARLVSMGIITFNFQEVIEFLSNEYEKTKEPALLYGAGIISYYWGDKILAKQDLVNFLKQSDERNYKEMYRNANKLVKSI